MMLVLHLSAGLHQGRRICAVLAFTLILIVAPTFAQTPLTPVIGVSPSPIDFGSVLVGSCEDVTADLFNVVPDPASLLEVTEITVTGEGFGLFSGPSLPVTIPGDGSTVPLVVRFCPLSEGSASGTLAVRASNAQALDVSLLGEGASARGDPFSEDITLGQDKELVFESVDGSFGLRGGNVLLFEWTGEAILLNGMVFWPGPTQEEYLRWRGPYTRKELTRYQDIPFIQQRIAVYGNTDSGWNRAYTEWDSLRDFTLSHIREYCDGHPREKCIEFLLAFDQQHAGLLEWAREHEIGIEVKWKGYPIPILSPVPFRTPYTARPRAINFERARSALQTLKDLLEGETAAIVELSFGNIRTRPRDQRGG